jgi:hypothetical protein
MTSYISPERRKCVMKFIEKEWKMERFERVLNNIKNIRIKNGIDNESTEQLLNYIYNENQHQGERDLDRAYIYGHLDYDIIIKYFNNIAVFNYEYLLNYCEMLDLRLFNYILDKIGEDKILYNIFKTEGGRRNITYDILESHDLINKAIKHGFNFNRVQDNEYQDNNILPDVPDVYYNVISRLYITDLYHANIVADKLVSGISYLIKNKTISLDTNNVVYYSINKHYYMSVNRFIERVVITILDIYRNIIRDNTKDIHRQPDIYNYDCFINTKIIPKNIKNVYEEMQYFIKRHQKFITINTHEHSEEDHQYILQVNSRNSSMYGLSSYLYMNIISGLTEFVMYGRRGILITIETALRMKHNIFQHRENMPVDDYIDLNKYVDNTICSNIIEPSLENIRVLIDNDININYVSLFSNRHIHTDTFNKLWCDNSFIIMEQVYKEYVVQYGDDEILDENVEYNGHSIFNILALFKNSIIREILKDKDILNYIFSYIRSKTPKKVVTIRGNFNIVNNFLSGKTTLINNLHNDYNLNISNDVKIYNSTIHLYTGFVYFLTRSIEYYSGDRKYHIQVYRDYLLHCLSIKIYSSADNVTLYDNSYAIIHSTCLVNNADIIEINDIINDSRTIANCYKDIITRELYNNAFAANTNYNIIIKPCYNNINNEIDMSMIEYNGFEYINTRELFSENRYTGLLSELNSINDNNFNVITAMLLDKYLKNASINENLIESLPPCKRVYHKLLQCNFDKQKYKFYIKMFSVHLKVLFCQNWFIKHVYYNPYHPIGKKRLIKEYNKLIEELRGTCCEGMLVL